MKFIIYCHKPVKSYLFLIFLYDIFLRCWLYPTSTQAENESPKISNSSSGQRRKRNYAAEDIEMKLQKLLSLTRKAVRMSSLLGTEIRSQWVFQERNSLSILYTLHGPHSAFLPSSFFLRSDHCGPWVSRVPCGENKEA